VQWRPPGAGGTVGPLYKGFVDAVNQGLDKLTKRSSPIVGMIWMQGESDSGDQKMAEDYGKNLACLINDIRTEFKVPDMPFIFAQISKAPAWDSLLTRPDDTRRTSAGSRTVRTRPHSD